MYHRVASAAALAAPLALAACASPQLAYEPDALRTEIARRAPALAQEEVVVPFELDEASAARARALVGDSRSEEDKVGILVAALFDPSKFALAYADGVTGTATDTLRVGKGNCLALASVFVGLARAAGLRAYYMDASAHIHETRLGDDGMAVNEGHVTAMVETSAGKIGLDFARLGKFRWYRILDDVEAIAHFYNNRGYELVQAARERAAPIDWSEASHQFRLAVAVMPGFARAWNNLGIAVAHLGRRDEAIAHWRESIRRDPALPAPRNNLGALYLEDGNDRAALETLEAAARLRTSGPHVHYNLALARLRNGDRNGAVEALRRALRLADYPRARELLDDLTVAAAPRASNDARP
jgi:tetratricopeptide (TPR) repeat protein